MAQVINKDVWKLKNQKLRGELGQYQAGTPEYDRVVSRINANRKGAGLKPRQEGYFNRFSKQQPVQPQANQQQVMQNNREYLKSIFPDVDAQKGMEGYLNSPGYGWRLKEGQRAMDRLMSARGLTNSGAEIQANRDLIDKMSADEYDRALGLSERTIDRRVGQGSQLMGMLERYAGRQDANAQNYFNNYYNLLALQAAQNPLGTAAQGVDSIAAQRQSVAQAQAAAARAAAGGGSGQMPFIPPFPSSPNYGTSSASGMFGSASSNNDFLGALSGLF